MKLTPSLLVALLLSLTAPLFAHTTDNARLLAELDRVIADRATYHASKEASLAELKQQLAGTSDLHTKYLRADDLFRAYLHYQADSAFAYLGRKRQYAVALGLPDSAMLELRINRAEVRGVMGMYDEALRELHAIDSHSLSDSLRIYYFKTARACYGWMADYALGGALKQAYLEQTDLYRDSILMAMPAGIEREITLADRLLQRGDASQALDVLQCALTKLDEIPGPRTDQLRNYVYYTLAEVYRVRGETERQVHYLALTSLADLRAAICEYASLQELAQVLYGEGDVRRAYRYLSRSMEDAVACNARLRFIEVTQFFPIIDRSYKLEEQRDRVAMRIFTGVLLLLGVVLVVLVAWLYREKKRLAAIRLDLSHTVSKLEAANQALERSNCALELSNRELEQTGHIKDVYIARYLDRCVSYLNKLDAYRRSLLKQAMGSHIDELVRALKSEQFINEERKNFYVEFDKSFLELFPNFVDAFNALLVEEGRIYPKAGELLTTELRIFALIRLGVTDSNKIASFLGYSLATIYNYRSKVRNKAIGDKAQFEQDVMNLLK